MARDQFLQIRISKDDLARIERVATAEHLEKSTWARRELLKAVERWEARRAKGEGGK